MEWGCFLSGESGIIRVHFLLDNYDSCRQYTKQLCLYGYTVDALQFI